MSVIPAEAGTQRTYWAPAFAGVTKLLLALFLALFAIPAAAQTFPPLTGRVVDDAHILSPATIADLTSKSEALEAKTSRQLVIATVPSLQGDDIEDFGYRLGRAWGIGQKKLDNGIILLVAPNEHKVRIEVGYGATAYLTDAMSGLIIREDILPHFKQGDYDGGVEAGADAIIKQVSLPPDQAEQAAAQAAQQQQAHRSGSGGALPIVFWVMIIGFVLLSKMRRIGGRGYRYGRRTGISPWVVLWGVNALGNASRGRDDWGGGGGGWGGGGFGGGGGFSGGGGSFGGGGASGSW
ncbi:MAG TPA: YgcG family protein [Sphingomicrobium sp.]|nr:YgcG family protein [Sphingomicrobium sp.]